MAVRLSSHMHGASIKGKTEAASAHCCISVNSQLKKHFGNIITLGVSSSHRRSAQMRHSLWAMVK